MEIRLTYGVEALLIYGIKNGSATLLQTEYNVMRQTINIPDGYDHIRAIANDESIEVGNKSCKVNVDTCYVDLSLKTQIEIDIIGDGVSFVYCTLIFNTHK